MAQITQSEISELVKLISSPPSDGRRLDAWLKHAHLELEKHFSNARLDRSDLTALLLGMIAANLTEITPSLSHQVLVNTYCKTGGLISELLSLVIRNGNFDSSETNYLDEKLFFKQSEFELQALISEINRVGYAILPFSLNASVIHELRVFARQSPFEQRDRYRDTAFSIEHPNCATAWATGESLSKNYLFQQILSSRTLISIAAAYLNASPHIGQSHMWWSFQTPVGVANSESAQMYHFDLDGLKFLKFFFYLTDVTAESGAHCFIPGTHKPGSKSEELLKRGYARIPDEDIARYQSTTEVKITGRSGTIICGDTQCFHKGSPVLSGNRLMMSIEYVNSKMSLRFDDAS